jgi:hypothetical protein
MKITLKVAITWPSSLSRIPYSFKLNFADYRANGLAKKLPKDMGTFDAKQNSIAQSIFYMYIRYVHKF